MHRFLSLLVVALLLALAAEPGAAAEVAGRWGVQLEGGVWKLVEGYWDHSNVDNFTGLSVRRGLSPYWRVELGYRYGTVRPGVESPDQDAGLTFDHFTTLYTEIHNPTFGLQYVVLPSARLTPFLGFGLGLASWRVLAADAEAEFFPEGTTVQGFGTDDGEYHKLQRNDLTLDFELGAEWFLAEGFSLRLGGRYQVLPGNDLDNVGLSSWNVTDDPAYVDANKGLAQAFLGATLWFGGPGDADRDGLEDRVDRCPRVAEDYDGFADDDGCPDYDNDNDSIADGDDPCPMDAEDRDGYLDDDGCPDPDNDNDGVLDSADQCPDEAEDFDGVRDDDGCPDRDDDGDGVLDGADQCPGTPAGVAVDASGCPLPEPPVAPEVQAIEAGLVLEGVSFRTGSAQLTPESISVLTRMAGLLQQHPDVRIEVRGHTDSMGTAENNRDLSQRRAMAVRDVLIQLGVSPSRVTAVGYGEDHPTDSNDTVEGRARNRRVELHRIK
ncbi:MAG TPA: OmpA family protein [Candidatus Krumholzibacteria bacterium]|nr:OmpA family protein [Candidatus Krumholzibacteria bacterium]HPD72016.1 OmpA family protein [Candidatus Krumholzibacteria bacterium]HRY41051.1 OmpA family protein [Candidatus Krumholzibacteria bacterium]